MAFGTREEFGSMLVRGVMDLVMRATGNTWRRQSGGGNKRDTIVNRIVTNVVHNCPKPPQLVVVPFKQCKISLEGTSLAIAIDDEGSEDLPYHDDGPNWVSVHQTLDWLVWDPTFTLGGYLFRKRSVWCLQLDLYPLSPYILARQFRQIAGYASAPGSVVLVVYIDQPIVELAKACGFVLEYDLTLDQIAVEEGLPNSGIRGLRIAKFTHEWKRPPTWKELNLAGIPSPREDLDYFLEHQGTDFSLVSPPRTPIKEIQTERTNGGTMKVPRPEPESGAETAGTQHKGTEHAGVETAGTQHTRNELAEAENVGNEHAGTELARTESTMTSLNDNTKVPADQMLANLESMISNEDESITLGAEVEVKDNRMCKFALRGPELLEKDGLFVLLIGSAEALGSWHCAGAVEMHRDGDSHVANVYVADSDAKNTSFEYKYALARRDFGARVIVAWENGENRLFKPSNSERADYIIDNVRAWQWV